MSDFSVRSSVRNISNPCHHYLLCCSCLLGTEFKKKLYSLLGCQAFVSASVCYWQSFRGPIFSSVDGILYIEEQQGSFLRREKWTKLYFSALKKKNYSHFGNELVNLNPKRYFRI